MKPTERNFWLDLSLCVTFLATVCTGLILGRLIPHQTTAGFLGFARQCWLTAHRCSGLAGAAGIGIHLAWHRDWFRAVRGRPLGGMPKKLRANRVVDQGLWITFIAANVCGAIAWALQLGDDTFMVRVADRLHVMLGVAWTLLVIVHLALHWKWIASTARRYRLINVRGSDGFQGQENA
jgi:hypothetical protein